jgi:hypothetical protein
MLQTVRSQIEFPVGSLHVSIDLIFAATL